MNYKNALLFVVSILGAIAIFIIALLLIDYYAPLRIPTTVEPTPVVEFGGPPLQER